jgi:hypothetical protein
MIPDQTLTALEAAEKLATERPWDVSCNHGDSYSLHNENDGSPHVFSWDNAALIALMRNSLPALLAEIRRLREENKWIRGANELLTKGPSDDR